MINDPEYARNAIYRHVKSGREYAIICCGQMESDETQVVVYQGNDGQVWVRPRNEFAAKFEPVEP